MTSQGPRLSPAAPPPLQVGAPSTVMSPQPAAREGGGSEEEGEGEGRGGDQVPGQWPLTQDTTRSRVWGRFAKLTGSTAAPARPAPNEAPSMAGPSGPRTPGALCQSVRRPALPKIARGCCERCWSCRCLRCLPGARTGRGGDARGGASPHPLTGPRTRLEPSGPSRRLPFHPQPSAA